MPDLKTIVEKEKIRTNIDDKRKVFLYKEGSFLRAYEWSAWLCSRYISEFKVTHKMVKSLNQSVAYIGFPVTSLEKFMPEGSVSDMTVLSEPWFSLPHQMVDSGLDLDAFEKWKNSFPVSEAKKKEEDKPTFSESNAPSGGLFSMAKRIVEYPVESKSPLECMYFLIELRKQVMTML